MLLVKYGVNLLPMRAYDMYLNVIVQKLGSLSTLVNRGSGERRRRLRRTGN